MSFRAPSKARSVLDADTSEEQFFEVVRELLNLYGWRWFHAHDSRRSNAGFPDIVAVKPPRLLFVELKSERGRLSREQLGWLASLYDCRYGLDKLRVEVWRPRDLERLTDILRGDE